MTKLTTFVLSFSLFARPSRTCCCPLAFVFYRTLSSSTSSRPASSLILTLETPKSNSTSLFSTNPRLSLWRSLNALAPSLSLESSTFKSRHSILATKSFKLRLKLKPSNLTTLLPPPLPSLLATPLPPPLFLPPPSLSMEDNSSTSSP